MSRHDIGGARRLVIHDDKPCPTVMACGVGSVNTSQYEIKTGNSGGDGVNKPPYRVPSMVEIAEIPWNGFTVASTFSGCGGSCLGYRMAGFKVAWANEFVPTAQDSYRANAPDCYLDTRDIRDVQPEEILEVLGMKSGDLDLFDGSPPCQAFSTAGKREKGWGELKTYEHGAKQANETLFSEYIRLLRGLKPKVFVAENVSGLVKGTAKGYFLEILAALKASGYRVSCRVLDAQWLGVPQQRQRTIFVGVREDLKLEPAHPEPLPYRYSVRDALPWIGQVVHETVGTSPSSGNGLATSVYSGTEKRKLTIDELKRICGFPDDFILKGTYAQQWERLGNSVPPVMMSHIAKTIRDKVLNGEATN